MALATAAGDSSPARPEDHALEGRQLAQDLDEPGGGDVVAGVHHPAAVGVEVGHRVAQALGRDRRLEDGQHRLLDQALDDVAVAAFVDGLDLDLARRRGRQGVEVADTGHRLGLARGAGLAAPRWRPGSRSWPR